MVDINELDNFIIVLSDILEKRRKLDSQSVESPEAWRYYYEQSNHQYDRLVNMYSDALAEIEELRADKSRLQTKLAEARTK